VSFEKIIVICGRICSGKTTLAQKISLKYNLHIASFGRYLKNYCEINNLPIDRKHLQDTGNLLVLKNPFQFVNDVINYSANGVDKFILEGVRHKSVFDSLNQFTANRISIFAQADIKTRFNRYSSRGKDSDDQISFEQFKIVDSHPVENEIETLKEYCDIIIDTTKDYSPELYSFLSRSLM
jgi:cytidylate kinase